MTIVRRAGAYLSTKIYDDINCIFRLWNAEDPKDRVLKSYNLKIKVLFESHYLDHSYAVLDDNHDCLREFNKMLNSFFRNKTVVALDDPEMSIYQALDHKGMIFLSTLPVVSPEKIAEEIFNWFKVWLSNSKLIERVDIRSVDITVNNQHTCTYVE